MKIEPGDIFQDKDHKWSSPNLSVIFLVLSGETGYWSKDKMVWSLAEFMGCGNGFCGAPIKELYEEEVLLMERIGSLTQLFPPPYSTFPYPNERPEHEPNNNEPS